MHVYFLETRPAVPYAKIYSLIDKRLIFVGQFEFPIGVPTYTLTTDKEKIINPYIENLLITIVTALDK